MRRGIFPGWWVVALAFLAQFMGWGLVGWAFALFVVPMEAELGWGREVITLGVTLRLAMAGLASPLVGSMMDRRNGPRVMIVVAGLVGGLATMLLGAVDQLWQFYLLFGVLGGLATSAAFELLGPVVVPKWFVRRRGLALALANQGPPMAGVILAPAIHLFISQWGWRQSWVAVGVLTLLLVVPLAARCLHRQPEDIGLYPDGAAAPPTLTPASPGLPPVEPQWTLGTVVRMPVLWLLVLGFSSYGLASSALSVHRVPFLMDQGFSQGFATTVVFFNGLLSIALKVPWGYLGDRFPVRWLIVGILLSMTLGVTFLMNATSLVWVVLFVMFWSGAVTGISPLESSLWASYFGRGNLGRLRGITYPLYVSIRAGGPGIAGLGFAVMGSYQGVFVGLSLYLLLGAALIAMARRPRWGVVTAARGQATP